jgi:hypothetical protein
VRRKKRKGRELEAYINTLGLNTNNKLNILNKNPTLNEGRKLANSRLQMKINEKRNKNKTSLSIHLNKLGLTNNEKNQFFANFNQNINLNTIKSKANTFAQTKSAQQKEKKREELQEYLTKLNLTNKERMAFMNKFNRNVDDANALKKEANTYLNQKIKQKRVYDAPRTVPVLEISEHL